MEGIVEDGDGTKRGGTSLWIYPLLEGITALLAGTVLLFYPKTGLIFISMVFGILIMISGVGQTVLVLKLGKGQNQWGSLLTKGILKIAFGFIILVYPFGFAKIGMGIPLVLAGVFLILGGLQELFRDQKTDLSPKNRTGNILVILLGALLCFAPVFSALLLFRLLGAVALLRGIYQILRAIAVKTDAQV